MQSSHVNSGQPTWSLMSIFLALVLALSGYGFAFNAAADETKPNPARISKEQAVQNAVTAVPGNVTDVAIEKKGGKNVYVVEIVADKDGAETDVLVDIDSGKVLGIER
jgi:uncharacterized membrane protein YkoI